MENFAYCAGDELLIRNLRRRISGAELPMLVRSVLLRAECFPCMRNTHRRAGAQTFGFIFVERRRSAN